MMRTARAGALAALLALTMVAPALAEEATVPVTGVTLNGSATLNSELSASVRLSGTITCAAEGPADLTTTIARQGAVEGRDNWDLYEFPCSTQARPFEVVVESLTCDVDFAPDQCFTRGTLEVEVTDSSGARITSAQVVVGDGSNSQGNGNGNGKGNGKGNGNGNGKGKGKGRGQGAAAQSPAGPGNQPSQLVAAPVIGTLQQMSIWAARKA